MHKKGRCLWVYKARFEGDNGRVFDFGKDNVFDINAGDGVSVSMGTAQGFAQIGEVLQSQSIGGRTLKIQGVLINDIADGKKRLRGAFSPFNGGKLIFNNEYYMRVFVKNTPTFSPVKDDGRFSLQLFAPIPFFYSISERRFALGAVKPLFSFPVNYGQPHYFGETMAQKIVDVVNDGDANTALSVEIRTKAAAENIIITNLKTFEFLKINVAINLGDVVKVWRDEDNVLRATLTSNGEITDIITQIDEASELFELRQGENLLTISADSGGDNLNAVFAFNSAAVSVYEA